MPRKGIHRVSWSNYATREAFKWQAIYLLSQRILRPFEIRTQTGSGFTRFKWLQGLDSWLEFPIYFASKPPEENALE